MSLDSEKLGYRLFPQSETRQMEPGHHTLKVHNALVWKTVEFDVAPGGHARFLTCTTMGSGSFSMLLMIGGGPLSVAVERLPDPPTTTWRPLNVRTVGSTPRRRHRQGERPGSDHRLSYHTPSTYV